MDAARLKLAEVRESYEECGGTPAYWGDLEREVLETALPQYIPAAVEQTRLETGHYDLWRQGDPVARAVFALVGLLLGGDHHRHPMDPHLRGRLRLHPGDGGAPLPGDHARRASTTATPGCSTS